MAKRARRSEDGFNLSFLDVMACGLGAVILIFILVDFQDIAVDTTEEKKRLEQELSAEERQQLQLNRSLDEINQRIAMATSTESEAQEQQEEIEADLADINRAIENEQAVISELEDQRAAILAKVNTPSPITKTGVGEQNYIVGMPVEGRNIGILIDKSVSMMATDLVDILLATTYPDSDKVKQPKWQRSINIAQWLISRLPSTSKVTVVVYSEDAKVLGPSSVLSANASERLSEVIKELGAVIPNGGTNLKLGLDTLMDANPRIDSIYMVTDGLPTMGISLRLSSCASISRRSTISAECRSEMGTRTLSDFLKKHPRVTLNTILLPIEGDPFASPVYWNATWATGGKMLSPALEWN